MWWLLLAACAKRGGEQDEGPIPGLLARADAAWRDRASVGLDAVEAPLTEAWQVSPTDPGVRWRLARTQVERALVLDDPTAAAAAFASARNFAVECVEADPQFVRTRAEDGWTAAVAALGPERIPCAAWAGIAWTRWLALRGSAGQALDLPAVDALLGTAALGQQDEQAARAAALLLAIRPVWDGRDLAAAARQLDAPERGPGATVHAVDRLTWALVPLGDAGAIADVCGWLPTAPDGTEADRAAKARGLALCEAR